MAKVIITLKILPKSPDIPLTSLKTSTENEIKKYGGIINKTEEVPLAFGLKEIHITFSIDESKGGTDALEAKIQLIPEIQSVNVISCSRALG